MASMEPIVVDLLHANAADGPITVEDSPAQGFPLVISPSSQVMSPNGSRTASAAPNGDSGPPGETNVNPGGTDHASYAIVQPTFIRHGGFERSNEASVVPTYLNVRSEDTRSSH